MRIEIYDCNGQNRTITSRDPKLLGAWFAEHAAELMSADVRTQESRINIWPQDRQEAELIGAARQYQLTQDHLLELAQVMLDASKKLGDLEDARALRA